VLHKAGIATEGLSLASEETALRKGDTVTALVEAVDGKRRQQWAVTLSINGIKPEQEKLRSEAFSMYLNSGRQVDFVPAPFEGIAIHVLGPFVEDEGDGKNKRANREKDIWSGALVNPQFLALGLDRTPALIMRCREATPADSSFTLGARSRAFSAEEIAASRDAFARLAVSESEERSYAGFTPALLNFFSVANQTPGVREIVAEATDIPWWSIIAHGGKITKISLAMFPPFEELPPANWGLPPDAKVYSIGLQLRLQEQPALNCRLAVTAPRVPLLNSAGIVGLAAMRPNGKGPRLMIRIVAGKPASPMAPPEGASAM
jgi:hypothetical protein